MMVTGLLMLPGYNFVRRLRKKKLDKLSEEEEEILADFLIFYQIL